MNQSITTLLGALEKLNNTKHHLTVESGVWWLWKEVDTVGYCLRDLRKVVSTKDSIILYFAPCSSLIITQDKWIDQTM